MNSLKTNNLLADKIQSYFLKDDYFCMLACFSSDEYIDFIYDNIQIFKRKDYFEGLIVGAWTGNGTHSAFVNNNQKWIDLFKIADKSKLMLAGDPVPVVDKLYRGTIEGDVSGLSWTSKKEIAVEFANRRCGKTILLERAFNKNELLFYTNDRQEFEFVLNNDMYE